jgi:hypothetical protein
MSIVERVIREISNSTDLTYVEGRFRGFFNGGGNRYREAIGYFHSLNEDQKGFLKDHPDLGAMLDLAIDEVMYGNNGR